MHTPGGTGWVLGYEKSQDPTPGMGKAQSGVPVELLKLTQGPLACTEDHDDRFSGSWALKTLMSAKEELKVECRPLGRL